MPQFIAMTERYIQFGFGGEPEGPGVKASSMRAMRRFDTEVLCVVATECLQIIEG